MLRSQTSKYFTTIITFTCPVTLLINSIVSYSQDKTFFIQGDVGYTITLFFFYTGRGSGEQIQGLSIKVKGGRWDDEYLGGKDKRVREIQIGESSKKIKRSDGG